jgi:hypothetical protein
LDLIVKHHYINLDKLSFGLLFVINVINFLFCYFIYSNPKTSYILKYLGLSIYFFQFLSHVLTAVMNPGIPSRERYISNYVQEREKKMNQVLLKIRKEGYKICSKCNIVVPGSDCVSHCEDCDICIEGNLIL